MATCNVSGIDSRPERPVLIRCGFKLDSGRFTVNGVRRYEASRLRELFDPGRLLLKEDERVAEAAADRLLTKNFCVAQLQFYDIEFRLAWDYDRIFDLLYDSVFAGQCEHLPESVSQLKEDMECEYEPLFQEWQHEAQAWDDVAFSRCKTPGERANQDFQQFFNFYFLTDRRPDKTKTPEPLALHGLRDRRGLHEAAEDVLGLETKSGGSGENRTLCIGWDRSAVWNLARELDRPDEEEKKRQQEADWEASMETHRDYVADLSLESTRRPFGVPRCKGSYIVQCGEITRGWSHIEKKLSLDISLRQDGSLEAAYDFNIIEGTMLLDLSEEKVASLAIELDSDGGQDEFDEEEEEEEEGSRPSDSRKRAAPAASSLAKKRRTEPSNSRQLYFRMRGRETGEAEIFYDPEPGHIDFLDDDCTQFVGLMYNCFILGTNVEFRGFKTSDAPANRPEDWSDFSGGCHEYARVARWG